jgi:hypothetical protein
MDKNAKFGQRPWQSKLENCSPSNPSVHIIYMFIPLYVEISNVAASWDDILVPAGLSSTIESPLVAWHYIMSQYLQIVGLLQLNCLESSHPS